MNKYSFNELEVFPNVFISGHIEYSARSSNAHNTAPYDRTDDRIDLDWNSFTLDQAFDDKGKDIVLSGQYEIKVLLEIKRVLTKNVIDHAYENAKWKIV